MRTRQWHDDDPLGVDEGMIAPAAKWTPRSPPGAFTEGMRRVLVLGGTGWLGSAIAEAAVAEGAEVVCLARGESGGAPEGAQLVRADRRQPGAYALVEGEWDEVIELAREVTGFPDELVSMSDEGLLAHDVRYWSGPRSLPLWFPAADTALLQRSGEAFLESGGALRPVRETLRRTLEDEIERGPDRPRRSGLTAAEEGTVLRSAR